MFLFLDDTKDLERSRSDKGYPGTVGASEDPDEVAYLDDINDLKRSR